MREEDNSLNDLFKDVQEAIGPLDQSSNTHSENGKPLQNVDASAFPTEMDCSQAFDQLLKCYSLGGQMRSYYRYGEMNYCYDKRDKLKFCLKTKLMSENDQKEKIREWHMRHLAEQQAKKQTSEFVWNSRETPLRLPFREDSAKYLRDNDN